MNQPSLLPVIGARVIGVNADGEFFLINNLMMVFFLFCFFLGGLTTCRKGGIQDIIAINLRIMR